MRSRMGMKGAPPTGGNHCHLCLFRKEWTSSSFADFQLNRVCRFQGKLPWVKARAPQLSARANRDMSCLKSESSRVLVETNDLCGTTQPGQDIRPRLVGVGSRHQRILLPIQARGGKALCESTRVHRACSFLPERSSRFVSERLETPPLRLPFGGHVGLAQFCGGTFSRALRSHPVWLFNL